MVRPSLLRPPPFSLPLRPRNVAVCVTRIAAVGLYYPHVSADIGGGNLELQIVVPSGSQCLNPFLSFYLPILAPFSAHL